MTERQPSIGIEIELPWKVMLARVNPDAAEILARAGHYNMLKGNELDIVQAAMDEVDNQFKEKMLAAHTIIGKGTDGYTEFAHLPRKSIEPVMDEVGDLFREDLLRVGEQYPLHITLGGIAVGSASGQLLFALEVVGNIRPERILQTHSWSRKGKAGMMKRQPHELSLGYKKGVEFRTLELYSPGQLRAMLHVGLSAASVIINNDGWEKWQAVLTERARIKNLDLTKPWPSVRQDPAHWMQYAFALEDTYWVRDSVHEIMDLID
jgi:hypothetical protein